MQLLAPLRDSQHLQAATQAGQWTDPSLAPAPAPAPAPSSLLTVATVLRAQ
jgi:hypothetical protein